jgi:hypothetical protein
MTNLYIGTRAEYKDINTALGRSVSRLNQRMSDTLRSIARKQGIKKTEQRARLEFYSVNKEELDKLCSEKHQMLISLKGNQPLRPLIAVDADKMNAGIVETNSRYNGRMDSDTHHKYLKELEQAVEDSVVKIGEDLNIRKRAESGTHDYAVGDWIEVYGDYGFFFGHARITRVTKASYWYELASIYNGRFNNYNTAVSMFKNVTGWNRDQEWDFTIPYKGNEEAFTFGLTKRARGSARPYGNPNKVEPGYRSYRNEC